jgi:hypothetical protein
LRDAPEAIWKQELRQFISPPESQIRDRAGYSRFTSLLKFRPEAR